MAMRVSRVGLSLITGLLTQGLFGAQQPDLSTAYIEDIQAESPEAASARHRQVNLRREGGVLMVHRGATAFAAENSLEAFAAAMDYGADGCEVDIRRTRDGVLVLFHDETLDRLTRGFGPVNQLTYGELCALRPRLAFGRMLFPTPPTFSALLDVARQRAMLLHLDLKEPGLEPGVARLLDVTDTWDHVVSVNRSNATNLLQHPKLRLLEYKGPGLYDGRKDVDPASIEAILTQPGQMLLVDDPRVAVLVMRREPYAPRPLLRNLRVRLQPPGPLVSSTNEFRAMDYVRALNSRASALSLDALERLLDPAPSEVGVSARDDATGIPRAAAIVRRAWAAQRLATIGVKSRQTTKRLEKLVLDPTFHSDQAYSHLDGAEAAYALGELGAIESAGTLVKAFRQPAPDHLRAPWGDYRLKHAILVALGDLRCRKASKFLRQYTVMDEEQARQFGLPQWETATSALLRQRLMWDQVADLLRSTNLAVRGTAILACLDPLTEERRAAIRAGAQWVSALPRPKR